MIFNHPHHLGKKKKLKNHLLIFHHLPQQPIVDPTIVLQQQLHQYLVQCRDAYAATGMTAEQMYPELYKQYFCMLCTTLWEITNN
eukprot:UN03970